MVDEVPDHVEVVTVHSELSLQNRSTEYSHLDCVLQGRKSLVYIPNIGHPGHYSYRDTGTSAGHRLAR